MLISTANDLPGYQITEVLGEVFGLTVRARNIGSQFGAGLKSIMGGELKGMTTNLANSRNEVIQRMVEEAQAKGGNAIVGHAVRHLRDGRHLDRDLRVRHRRHREPGPTRRPDPAPRLTGRAELRESTDAERRQIHIGRSGGHQLSDRLAQPGGMLEAVPGARGHEQDAGQVGVLIDHEVGVRRHRVQAPRLRGGSSARPPAGAGRTARRRSIASRTHRRPATPIRRSS